MTDEAKEYLRRVVAGGYASVWQTVLFLAVGCLVAGLLVGLAVCR